MTQHLDLNALRAAGVAWSLDDDWKCKNMTQAQAAEYNKHNHSVAKLVKLRLNGGKCSAPKPNGGALADRIGSLFKREYPLNPKPERRLR